MNCNVISKACIALISCALISCGGPKQPVPAASPIAPETSEDTSSQEPGTAETTDDGQTDKKAKTTSDVIERPQFDESKPPPCTSHTSCYLSAQQAHNSGRKAGYLVALEKCEYYRAAYQLEKFYGLCLFILADCYRHLNNFDESISAYQRFLDTHPADDLALEARASIEEVNTGRKKPELYKQYLKAASLIKQFNNEKNISSAKKALEILHDLHSQTPDWELNEHVVYLKEATQAIITASENKNEPTSDISDIIDLKTYDMVVTNP